ncbi:hypothetical protein [Shewanella sp.]|uniref:hypothetical protein n=2 Tax=Shewanella TaxID=22 RepID=UPI001B64A47F|nr:hypothetical protein [Shewanella sp.]MBP6519385.1 hypothetical protein [Shewanella sp.]
MRTNKMLHTMKISELQLIFIEELKILLPHWKFIKSNRQFKLKQKNVIWYFHIACINHASDFYAVGSVSVEYIIENERVCSIGAELGNIEGSGQTRFAISNPIEAKLSAQQLFAFFEKIGLVFLQRYSNPTEVISTLQKGGKEAMLISPIISLHQKQISSLTLHYVKNM